MSWTRSPPTAAEVRDQRWWWRRLPGHAPHIVELIVHALTGRVMVDCGDSLVELESDEPGEWAPCMPP